MDGVIHRAFVSSAVENEGGGILLFGLVMRRIVTLQAMMLRGEQDAVAHAAIGMDADDPHLCAAVGAAAAAGRTFAARHIWIHGAAIARLEAAHGAPALQNFDRQLMAENARIGEERLSAFE